MSVHGTGTPTGGGALPRGPRGNLEIARKGKAGVEL